MRLYAVILGIILGTAVLAAADCTTTTLIHPSGRVQICSQCCIGGSCTITCS